MAHPDRLFRADGVQQFDHVGYCMVHERSLTGVCKCSIDHSLSNVRSWPVLPFALSRQT